MKRIFFLAVVIFMMASCGSNEDRAISENVAAFIESNPSISNFGSVNVKAVLEKAEYKSIDKFGSEISKEFDVIQKLISTDKPIYFAMDGISSLNGEIPIVYAFAEVKNRDSLVSNIQKRGFDMNKSKAYDFHESGDVAFAITNKSVVFVAQQGLKNGKTIVEKAIEGLKGDEINNKVLEILNSKGDVVIGNDLEAAYTSVESSMKVEKSVKSELSNMAKSSYSKTIINFEKGAINLKTENYFSDQLNKLLALGDNTRSVVEKLGSGKPQAAFAMNVDMKKIQLFIDKYAPNLLNQIAKEAGGQAQFALAFLGDEGLAGLISGKLGVAIMGQPDASGAFKPEFNFYVSLGKSSLPFVQGFAENSSESMAKVELKGTELSGYTSANYLPGKNGLTLPKGCQNFGRKPISGFVNFDGIDLSNFDLEDKERYVKLIDFITFEYDAKGGSLHVELKNKQKNVLKQLVDEASQDVKDKIQFL